MLIIAHLNLFVLFNCKQLRERLRNKILTEKHKEEKKTYLMNNRFFMFQIV